MIHWIYTFGFYWWNCREMSHYGIAKTLRVSVTETIRFRMGM